MLLQLRGRVEMHAVLPHKGIPGGILKIVHKRQTSINVVEKQLMIQRVEHKRVLAGHSPNNSDDSMALIDYRRAKEQKRVTRCKKERRRRRLLRWTTSPVTAPFWSRAIDGRRTPTAKHVNRRTNSRTHSRPVGGGAARAGNGPRAALAAAR